MNTTKTNRIARYWLAAATVFAGGTVLGTCELRVHDALVTTAESLVFGVFETTVGDLVGSLEAGKSTADTTE